MLRKFARCFSTRRGAGQCYQHGARGLAQRWNPDGIFVVGWSKQSRHTTQNKRSDWKTKPKQQQTTWQQKGTCCFTGYWNMPTLALIRPLDEKKELDALSCNICLHLSEDCPPSGSSVWHQGLSQSQEQCQSLKRLKGWCSSTSATSGMISRTKSVWKNEIWKIALLFVVICVPYTSKNGLKNDADWSPHIAVINSNPRLNQK